MGGPHKVNIRRGNRALIQFLLIILVVSISCFGFSGCNLGVGKSRHENNSDHDDSSFWMQFAAFQQKAQVFDYLYIETGPDDFCLAAEKLFGTKLTESDFTDDIRVPGANRHCVVSEDDITLIYLEFPSSWETTEYWEYEMSLDYFDDWLSWNNDSQHCFMIRKDDTTQGFYRCGNVVISFAGGSGATDLQKKSNLFFKTVGCPTTEKVAELIEDNSASDAET